MEAKRKISICSNKSFTEEKANKTYTMETLASLQVKGCSYV